MIRVGLVGCGRMGVGVINQISQCRGMRVVAVADMKIDRARVAAGANLPKGAQPPLVTSDLAEANGALDAGFAANTSHISE